MTRPARLITTSFLLIAGSAGGFWFAKRAPAAQTQGRKILYWVDPMHPAYKSDRPGIAPDCGMKLEPVYSDSEKPKAQGKILYYRDPKDPTYHAQTPGLNPATGNDLEAVYEGSAAAMPAGTVKVAADQQQLIGVKFATAEMASSAETVRAAGKVAPDETRITRVHPKIEGWIYNTHVDFMGQLVKKGDPLLTLYSPEMLATQQEFLLALRARDAMKVGPSHEAYENSELLIEAARHRLELWDFGPAQIEELERTRKTIRTITVYSPASGYVTSRNAFPSQRVTPETELYAITDLSRVWITVDIFEADMARVHPGQTATVSTPSESGRSFIATVRYIQPQIDPATRTLKVRLEAPNPKLELKPDLFVNVEFRFGSPSRLTVPADAVVNTGTRQTVFVDLGGGNLEPRSVKTGERSGDRIQVLEGLRAGERVVAAGAFLIDSEAQLKNGPAPGGATQ